MRLHVGQGTTVGPLTVFPVWNTQAAAGRRRYVTGAETLTVTELESGPSVPRLVARNTGDLPVLILDGQLFEGGWQHRMATRSALVPAHGRLEVDVACVEQRRWHGGTEQSTRGRRASTYVRRGFDEPHAQQEVWRRVDRCASDEGRTGPTGSLLEHLDRLDRDEERVHRLLGDVRPLLGQTGVLVGVGGQPLTLEVFDHPDTLREQHDAILRAAVLDAAGRPALATPGRRARRMVERLERTRLVVEPDVGRASRLARARTTDLDVMAVRHAHLTLHLRATHVRNPVLQEA